MAKLPNKLVHVQLSNSSAYKLTEISYELFDKDENSLGSFPFIHKKLPSGGDPLLNEEHKTEGGVDARKLVLSVKIQTKANASKLVVTADEKDKKVVLGTVDITFLGLDSKGDEIWQESHRAPAIAVARAAAARAAGLPPKPFVKFKLASSPSAAPPIRFFRFRTYTRQNAGGVPKHDDRVVDYQAPMYPLPIPVLFTGEQAPDDDVSPSDKTIRSVECWIMAGEDQSPRGPAVIQDSGRGINLIDATYAGFDPLLDAHIVIFGVSTTDETGANDTTVTQIEYFG